MDEDYTGRPLLSVVPENVSSVQNMFIDNNSCTYNMIQEKLKVVSVAIHKIIYQELQKYIAVEFRII